MSTDLYRVVMLNPPQDPQGPTVCMYFATKREGRDFMVDMKTWCKPYARLQAVRVFGTKAHLLSLLNNLVPVCVVGRVWKLDDEGNLTDSDNVYPQEPKP